MSDLGSMISSIISSVPSMLPGIKVDITVNLTSTEIDPTTNKRVSSVAQQQRFQATIAELTEDEKESSVLRVTELKLLVFTNGAVIDSKSSVSISRQASGGLRTEKYDIIQCDPTYVGTNAVINMLYLKK